MRQRPALLGALLAGLALLVAPSPARAAEGFVGTLANGSLIRFQSDSPGGLTLPVHIPGLMPRELVVALGSGRGRVYAVGSSARLYGLNPMTGRAVRIGAGPLEQGLRGRRFSLAVSPDGMSARLLSDVGQNLQIDLRSGVAQPLPELKRGDNGQPAFPAAAFAGDGRLVGIDIVRRELLTETAAGSGVLAAAVLHSQRGVDLAEPAAFDIDPDGRAWALASFGGRDRARQSLLMPIDLAASGDTGAFRPFLRQVVTFTSLGRVADDARPPAARISGPRQLSVRALLAGRFPMSVTVSEGAQVMAWLRLDHHGIGTGLSTRDTPGVHRFRSWFVFTSRRAAIRRAVGRRAHIAFTVADFAGNRREVVRTVRLTR